MSTNRRRWLCSVSTAAAALLTVPVSRMAMTMNETRSIEFIPAVALPETELARHEKYMAMAIDLAEAGPGPFGTVIVDPQADKVMCTGVNQHKVSPILHGEIVAINNCAKIEPTVDWRRLDLYTSAEPCPMCQSAIVWAGVSRVIYGTSIDELARFGIRQIRLDSPTVSAAASFYSGSIIAGVLKSRSDTLYRRWAKSRGRSTN